MTSGRELGADLYRLYRMATRNLPDVAREYDAAAMKVEDVGHATNAFRRSPAFGGDHGPAFAPWLALHSSIRQSLAGTAEFLRESATSLRYATEEFAKTDAAARDELNRLIQENQYL